MFSTGGFGDMPRPISQCQSGGSPFFFYHISPFYASGSPLRDMLHLGNRKAKLSPPRNSKDLNALTPLF
jgi:hypothetical protein